MPQPLDDSSLPDAESHLPAVYMVFSVALRIVGVVGVVLTLLDRRVLVSFALPKPATAGKLRQRVGGRAADGASQPLGSPADPLPPPFCRPGSIPTSYRAPAAAAVN